MMVMVMVMIVVDGRVGVGDVARAVVLNGVIVGAHLILPSANCATIAIDLHAFVLIALWTYFRIVESVVGGADGVARDERWTEGLHQRVAIGDWAAVHPAGATHLTASRVGELHADPVEVVLVGVLAVA